ncbi:hypothetical protein [Formosa algae]|uniref:hypothetical protein n=1 Tax=Formosa algae TaxID=225843 RepID=UPI000CCE2E4E|nr:hypothetical protein [Formosa algae]PNW28942.1 hypothetical protein BKP44_06790 [Formosa algae]
MMTRKPKQNFRIAAEKIVFSSLNKTQKDILTALLSLHKARCTREYTNLLNSEICSMISKSEDTFRTHRNILEKEKYFNIKKIRTGKSYVLQYRFNWSKLEKLGFIETTEKKKSEFTPEFKKEVKKIDVSKLNAGDELTNDNVKRLDDQKTYKIKIIGNSSASGRTQVAYGSDIKRMIKLEEIKLKSCGTKDFTHIYQNIS